MNTLISTTVILLFSIPVAAYVLMVPENYSTIQDAVDAAVPGDTVMIADGIYTGDGNRNIELQGKAIFITSENGYSDCILDVEYEVTGFHIHEGEGENTILNGITIKDASFGGIWLENSSPLLLNCWVRHNQFGGMIIENSDPVIKNCVMYGNNGNGLWLINSNAIVQNCNIVKNHENYGAGICMEYSAPIITSCIVSDNIISSGG